MDIQQRLRRHLSDHKGFTGRADDWVVLFSRTFPEKMKSVELEMKIKRRGADRFLHDLHCED